MIWLGVIHMKNNLKEVRLATGMTQEDFAESVGVSKTTYNNYETGRREPRSDFWMAIADKYNVTVDYLIGLTDDPSTGKGKPPASTLVVTNDETILIQNYRLCHSEDRNAIQRIVGSIARAADQPLPETEDELAEQVYRSLMERYGSPEGSAEEKHA